MPMRVVRNAMEPMSKVDTAWLRMERPTNLMMITGVMMFDGKLDVARFKRMLAQRFLAYRRFRQRAVDTPTGAYWEIDNDFDMDWHVRIAGLPGKAGKRELERLVSQLASTPLDQTKPLWQFHVVDNFQGGSAVITRIHHCYADGIALVQVLLSMADAEAGPEKRVKLERAWLKEDRGNVMDRLLQPAREGVSQAVHMGEKVIAKAKDLLADPQIAGRVIHEATEIARELANVLMLADDPPTRFIALAHGAVSTSGDARQHLVVAGRRYSHIIDPRSGEPVAGRRSVTVVAQTGMIADGLATAASVLGPARALELIQRFAGAELLMVSEGDAAQRTVESAGFQRLEIK